MFPRHQSRDKPAQVLSWPPSGPIKRTIKASSSSDSAPGCCWVLVVFLTGLWRPGRVWSFCFSGCFWIFSFFNLVFGPPAWCCCLVEPVILSLVSAQVSSFQPAEPPVPVPVPVLPSTTRPALLFCVRTINMVFFAQLKCFLFLLSVFFLLKCCLTRCLSVCLETPVCLSLETGEFYPPDWTSGFFFSLHLPSFQCELILID